MLRFWVVVNLGETLVNPVQGVGRDFFIFHTAGFWFIVYSDCSWPYYR